MKSVLVTGCSTGIGFAIAKELIAKNYRVFGSLRDIKQGEKIGLELGVNFIPLYFDVMDLAAIQNASLEVKKNLRPDENLAGLINNAGIATFGPLALQPIEEIKKQIEINVIGPIQVTKAFLPYLGMDATRKSLPGKIINISSIAGKVGGPFLGAYAASKHAMEGWSESLRRELMLYGIDVLIIGPGTIATPIWNKAESQGMDPYLNTDYEIPMKRFQKYMIKNGPAGLPAQVVADSVVNILASPKPCVRYVFTPNLLKNWLIPRFLPARWMDRLVAKNLRLYKQDPSN